MNALILESPIFSTMKNSHAEEMFYHLPILCDEVKDVLRPGTGKTILDGTLGGGGHSEMLLEQGARVIAIDQDQAALAYASRRLTRFGKAFMPVQGNFAESGDILDRLGVACIDGALLDLGVSSHQLDDPSRGFSFRENGPLDMRMDLKGEQTAADLVNKASVAELTQIFFEFGEEPRARQVAHRIADCRGRQPLVTTEDLIDAIKPVLPKYGKKHPATKVFMALRIAVNKELDVLSQGLEVITQRLAIGARFAVITFHSLEDRIVKSFFRDRSREWLNRPEWPAPRRNPRYTFRLLTSRPIEAKEQEIQQNPRARSAKLRVAEQLKMPCHP